MMHRLGERSRSQTDERGGRERGATLVEYALLVAFLGVGAIGAGKFLTTQGGSQVEKQANCVSRRPPPVSCQVIAVTTTSTTGVPISTSSTSTIPPPAAPTWSNATSGNTVGAFDRPWFEMTLAPAAQVQGTTIRVRVREYAPGVAAPGYYESVQNCTVTAAGKCRVSYVDQFSDSAQVTFQYLDSTADPAPGAPNAAQGSATVVV